MIHSKHPTVLMVWDARSEAGPSIYYLGNNQLTEEEMDLVKKAFARVSTTFFLKQSYCFGADEVIRCLNTLLS